MQLSFRVVCLILTAAAASTSYSGAVAAGATAPLVPIPDPMKQAEQIPDWAFKPGLLIDVGGHRMNMYCMGAGTPAVVMSSGWGWGAIAFSGIMPKIAQKTRVCAYDRADRGFSDDGPLHPPIGAEVADVHTALHKAGVEGPYIFAGWSAGGAESRRYAWTYPNEVVGIVTIDGSVNDFQPAEETQKWLPRAIKLYDDCAAAAEAKTFESNPTLLRTCAARLNPLDFLPKSRIAMGDHSRSAQAYAVIAQSLRDGPANDEALRVQRRPFGSMPFLALVAGNNFLDPADPKGTPEGTVAHQAFLRASYEIASLSADGVVVAIPYTTHSIQFGRPEMVVRWIDATVDEVRANPHPPTAAP
jgi:pimeloyl-ACP methyl ester carboxylesterase